MEWSRRSDPLDSILVLEPDPVELLPREDGGLGGVLRGGVSALFF